MIRHTYIYFVRPEGQEGPVKIGHSVYPASRLVTYMCWSPLPLELAAQIELTIPEGITTNKFAMSVERQFHLRYRDHWLHHEWFAAHDRLSRDIELIRKGRFRMSVLPDASGRFTRPGSTAYVQGCTAPTQRAAA